MRRDICKGTQKLLRSVGLITYTPTDRPKGERFQGNQDDGQDACLVIIVFV